VTKGIALIPYVGGILSGIIGLLWPDSPDSAWDKFRAEVEKMIDQKIKDEVYSLLRQELVGLGDVLKSYLVAVKGTDKEHIRTTFTAANLFFVNNASHFQNPDYEWVLAPLFAIFTNLHMMLLRDCVLHGTPANWGWTKETYQEYVQETGERLEAYHAYLNHASMHEVERLGPGSPTNPGKHRIAMHNYWQPVNQQRIVLIEDYRCILFYLDPLTRPDPTPTEKMFFLDAYSLAYGTADDWDGKARELGGEGVKMVYSTPLSSFRDIYVEFYDRRPRKVDVTYASGTGPYLETGPKPHQRVDKYSIIAETASGETPMHFSFPDPGPKKMFNVEKAQIRVGDIVHSLALVLDDGTVKPLWQSYVDNTVDYTVAVPGRMLTTLNMWTVSNYYHYDLGCILFGFSRDLKYTPPQVRRLLYITAIGRSSSEVTSLISPDATLKAEREAWWRHLETYKK